MTVRKIAPTAPANFDIVDCIDPLLPDWDVLLPGLPLAVLVGLAGVEEEVTLEDELLKPTGRDKNSSTRTPLARWTDESLSFEFK